MTVQWGPHLDGFVSSDASCGLFLGLNTCVHFSRGCDVSWPQCSSVLPVTGVPVNSRVSSKIQQLLNTLKRPKRPPLKEFFVDDFEELLEGKSCPTLSFCVCMKRVTMKLRNRANIYYTGLLLYIFCFETQWSLCIMVNLESHDCFLYLSR